MEERKETFLLAARCEDGENVKIETEWDSAQTSHIIGTFVALGVRMANDIMGEKESRKVYKLLEDAFRELQGEKMEESIRKQVEE